MSDQYLLPNGRILRYTVRERLLHWVAAISYVYLLLTGLAFWSPWLFWIAVVLGGATEARELHPWAGLIFVMAVVWMYVIWGSQMRETENDRKWWRSLSHYIRNEDEQMPAEERFNAGQKFLFWGFFGCGLALLASGLVLWFTQSIPWKFRYLRYASVIVHPVAALVTIALFMVHVYMGTAVERGAFGSVIRGDVSRAWAKKHHRMWYEEVLRRAQSNK